jgi:glycosidase
MLREIFPEQAPGSFSYRPEIGRWVWTTFNIFQWDLNYRNPEVFNAMLGEMLFLANVGVEILRLDAVAFIWKEMGTVCENLPQAHQLIQAFNTLVRLVAPGMVLKSEAIVHPDEVAIYFGEGEKAGFECPISYNPTLMALLWETLATREVRLLHDAMSRRFQHPENCAWVNYVRCHDDIGWSFADEDARVLNINGFDHRQFLNAFYTGQFPGSFGRGLLFNYNPVTRDGRISGTCASLAGLEFAVKSGERHEIDLAVRRIVLLHSVILSIGGIPLIYMGDELATLNDYRYESDPGKAQDNRWAHRPSMDWEKAAHRDDPLTLEGQVYQSLRQMIQIRQTNPVFAGGDTTFIESGNPHVFSYYRWRDGQGFLALCSFSEQEQRVDLAKYRVYGLKLHMLDMLTDQEVLLNGQFTLAPYQFLWLMCD